VVDVGSGLHIGSPVGKGAHKLLRRAAAAYGFFEIGKAFDEKQRLMFDM
jgi:hypothetical protein